jgi:hypothetical protein
VNSTEPSPSARVPWTRFDSFVRVKTTSLWCYPNVSTVVEYLPHHLEVEGSAPATDTVNGENKGEKMFPEPMSHSPKKVLCQMSQFDKSEVACDSYDISLATSHNYPDSSIYPQPSYDLNSVRPRVEFSYSQ